MGRQTAFPGVNVDSIDISGKGVPDRGFGDVEATEESILENAVNRGATKDFPGFKPAAELSSETIGKIIQELEDLAGPFVDSHTITYELVVNGQGISETAAERIVSMRARAFVRAKNPTEPEFIRVGQVMRDEVGTDDPITMYRVSASITK